MFAIGAVGVSLRDTLPPPEAKTNWYMDVAFRVGTKRAPGSPVGANTDTQPPPQIYTLLVWAPALFAPAIYGSLIHYHDVLVSVSPPRRPAQPQPQFPKSPPPAPGPHRVPRPPVPTLAGRRPDPQTLAATSLVLAISTLFYPASSVSA